MVRVAFKECTVFAIAHRLDTVADADKIAAFRAGKVAEYDSPLALLDQQDSIFRSLVEELGPEGQWWRLVVRCSAFRCAYLKR